MELTLFALTSSRALGERVAEALGIPLGAHEEREFEDGEHKSRPLMNVRGHDVFVLQSLHGDDDQSVNDKLVRLLFFLGALRDASAGRVTAVVPYLCYARKDRRTKARDPVATRYVAALFEAMGVDHVITMDVHNLAAYQNAFRIPADHLEAKKLFVECLQTVAGELAVVSPDIGGIKRAEAFRQAMEHRLGRMVPAAFMEKHRSAGVVSGEALVGDVAGRTVILVDDLIASGTTLSRAALACRAKGATAVYGVATHGAFSSKADAALSGPAFDELVITDSITPYRIASRKLSDKLRVLSISRLFANAIRCIHEGGSIVELLEV